MRKPEQWLHQGLQRKSKMLKQEQGKLLQEQQQQEQKIKQQ
jgi:hypothetical protein